MNAYPSHFYAVQSSFIVPVFERGEVIKADYVYLKERIVSIKMERKKMEQGIRSGAWLLFGFLFLLSCDGRKEIDGNARVVGQSVSELATIRADQLRDTASIASLFRQAKQLRVENADSSIVLLHDALNRSLAIHYLDGALNAVGYLAQLYSIKEDYDSSRKYYELGLDYALEYPPEKCVSEFFLSCIAKDFYFQGKYDSAFHYLYLAANNMEHHPVTAYAKAYAVYQNIGALWGNMGNLENASVYFDKAEEIALNSNDSMLITDLFVTKASYFQKNNLQDSSVKYYAIVLQSPTADTSTMIAANMNIGAIYMQSDLEPLLAIPYFERALSLSKTYFGAESKRAVHQINFKLGMAYVSAWRQSQERKYLQRGLSLLESIAKEPKDWAFLEGDMLSLHTNLANIYASTGRLEEAYEQSKTAIRLRDSLYQKEKLDLMGNLDVKFRTAEKDKQLAQSNLYIAQQKNKIQEKNFWIGGAAASTVLLTTLLLSAIRSGRRKRRLHEHQLQLMDQEHEITQLKAIMKGEEKERGRLARELHDGIGGMLASIKMNVSTVANNGAASRPQDLEEVLSLVEQTADEVRRTAHNLMPEVLRKYGFPHAMRVYCEGITGENAPQIDLQFHSSWPEKRLVLELPLYRILQELIQNALKHAQASHIVMQFRFHEDRLHVTIEDDGIGFEKDKVDVGLGLSNIHSRVITLKGKLDIESSPNSGTSCYIELPVEFEKSEAHG